MPEKKINTTATLRQPAKPQEEIEAELEVAIKRAKSEVEEVYVPEVYRASLGDPVKFSVDAIPIEFPIATKVKIPVAHAKHVKRLMKGAVINKSQVRLTPEQIYED